MKDNENTEIMGQLALAIFIGSPLLGAILCWPLTLLWNYGVKEMFETLPEAEPLSMFFIFWFTSIFKCIFR